MALGQAACSLVGYREHGDAKQSVTADAGSLREPEAGTFDASLGDARVHDAQVVVDGGGLDAETLDASEPDAAAPMDASGPVNDASVDQPPTVIPDDAGSSTDAGAAADAGAPDAGVTNCAGAPAVGLCWYLGAFGASCDETCTSHGGFDSRAIVHVGTTKQGGSLSDCSQILSALGFTSAAYHAYRTDDYALACHMWRSGVTYWLDDPSAFFRSSSSGPLARLACGCKR
ncbi:MAG: hypothetical protein JWN04_4882 [Myxococcaceae bacterium]|nr:hypothetical protein [Myxococcaceae bacterium]